MNVADIDAANLRTTADIDPAADGRAAALHPQFRSRWSPRALSGVGLTEHEVQTLLEAARWAPSCFNEQPWRFAYVLRDTSEWPGLLATLVEGNRRWADRAGALIAVASRTTFERNGQPAPTHAFDAGAAWMSLALQAHHQGLVAHGMRGFDVEAASRTLGLGEGYALWAIIAVGRPGSRDALPAPLRERETPSPRKPLPAIAYRGSFAGLS